MANKPTNLDGYRITKWRDERQTQRALVEWLGGFAQGSLDESTHIWSFVTYEPDAFPAVRTQPPLSGFCQLTVQVMDREGDDALIDSILRTRVNVARQRIRG